MRNASIVSAFLLLAACSSSDPDSGVEGSGGSGGSGGTGGEGREVIASDDTPPTLTILDPEDGSLSSSSAATIRGVATDDNGIARILVRGRDVTPAGTEGSNEVHFEFQSRLSKGKNTIDVQAIDVADNRAEVKLDIYFDLGELQLWPTAATISPGDRQLLHVEGAEVSWTADGDEILEFESKRVAFTAMQPGTYRVEAKTSEEPRRTATATITVHEHVSRVATLRGLGGQFAGSEHWKPSPVVDAEGTLWVPTPDAAAIARWRKDDGEWTLLTGAPENRFFHLAILPSGELLAAGGPELFRIATGTDVLERIDFPGTASISGLRVAEDGSIAAMTEARQVPARLWIRPPEGEFEEIALPEQLSGALITFGAGSDLYVAGMSGEGPGSLWRHTSGEWTALGPLPDLGDELHDLLVDDGGRVLLAGDGIARLQDGTWEDLSDGLLQCAQICDVYGLALRADGTLLAINLSRVHHLDDGRPFIPVGEPIDDMEWIFPGTPLVRAVVENAEGTLYIAGALGVYRLEAGETKWSRLGDTGIAPGAEARDLIVRPDGELILASGGRSHLEQDSLYRLDPNTGRWIGSGEEIGYWGESDSVLRIGEDNDGNVYGFTGSGFVFRVDAETAEITHLPTDDRVGYYYFAFGVAPDGTLFIVTYYDAWIVLKLRPGADEWTVDPSIPCAVDFENAPDGTLWAAGCPALPPFKLTRGASEWQPVMAGLPLENSLYDIAISADGQLLLASGDGTWRWSGSSWERFGFGEPSLVAQRITSGGGRSWAMSGGILYEMDEETECWVRATIQPPSLPVAIFEATPDGALLLSGGDDLLGLLEMR